MILPLEPEGSFARAFTPGVCVDDRNRPEPAAPQVGPQFGDGGDGQFVHHAGRPDLSTRAAISFKQYRCFVDSRWKLGRSRTKPRSQARRLP